MFAKKWFIVKNIALLYPFQSYKIVLKSMEVIILGCGFSLGCPVLACNCNVCTSNEKYNKRMRSAIIIRDHLSIILVDFGPDIKTQLLINNISKLDAIICTHDHADHTSGIDELRIFGYNAQKPIPLYSTAETSLSLQRKHGYLFRQDQGVGPFLEKVEITTYDKIKINNIEIQLFDQIHGENTSLGMRINNFVYSNDITNFPENTLPFLKNIDCWVLDCVDYKNTSAHSGLEDVLAWRERFAPKQIYLTNLGHNLDYNKLLKELPKNVQPAYDGISVTI